MVEAIRYRPVDLSAARRANLVKLADYLWALPTNYADFEMGLFSSDTNCNAHVVKCGTSACAVGHGPKAGIKAKPDEDWTTYSRRVFIRGDDEAWDWCFSGCWDDVDNSVHGAAARIDYLLKFGCPENIREQEMGEADLCYSTDRLPASGIAARSDETLAAQPEGQEPDPKGDARA